MRKRFRCNESCWERQREREIERKGGREKGSQREGERERDREREGNVILFTFTSNFRSIVGGSNRGGSSPVGTQRN